MTPPSPHSSSPRRTAFVVQAPSPLRRQLVQGLRQRGFAVQVADEPFAAMESLGKAPTDLVVASLDAFAPGDEGFFSALKRRAPATRIVVLVGEDEHELGRRAVRAGASASLPRPRDREDVVAVVHAVDRLTSCGGLDALGVLGPLGHELAHLFGNRLMTLVNLTSEVDLPDEVAARLERGIASIREATRRLGRFQELPPRAPRRTDLRDLVEAALTPRVDRGVLQPVEVKARGRPQVFVDRAAVRLALEDAADALAGLSAKPLPVALDVRLRRPRSRYEAFLPPPRATVSLVEVRLRVPGFQLDRAAYTHCLEQLIFVQDVTRRVHSGLRAAGLLLQRDGAGLLPSRGHSGSGLAIVFPLA